MQNYLGIQLLLVIKSIWVASKKIPMFMRLSIVFIMVFTGLLQATNTYSQTALLNIDAKDQTVKTVLEEIKKQSDFNFFYNNKDIDVHRQVSVKVEKAKIFDVLDKIFNGAGVSYSVLDNNIILSTKKVAVVSKASENTLKISGTVSDASGETIIGANVQIKGTTIGTATGMNGEFNMVVPKNAILMISYIGYKTQEIQITNNTPLDITLEEDAELLDEVMVVGYGIQRKSDLTGSVEVIKSDALVRQPVMQVSQSLSGLAPGLTATASSGKPGSDGATLRIRGNGSISASSNPLVLIDGVAGSINNLDPNDIESISILKDAGSSAIYGSRASNGVILVTTKRGKTGKISVSVNAYVGIQDVTDLPEFLGAEDYLKATKNDALLEQYLANPNDKDKYPDTRWADLLFTENGLINHQNISISGGSETSRTHASISHQKQNGNIAHYSHERLQMRVNNDFKLFDKINVQLDMNASRTNNKSPRNDEYSLIRESYRNLPIYAATFSNGKYAKPAIGTNPYAALHEAGSNNSQSTYLKGFTKLEYSPFDGFKVAASYGFNWTDGSNKTYSKQYDVYDAPNDEVPTIISSGTKNEVQLSMSNSKTFDQNILATAQYTKDFGNHHVDAILGYELFQYQYETFGASRYGFSTQLEVLNAGNEENDSNSGSATQTALLSYFGRANYSYDRRYMVAISLRRDGSSRFAPDSRWGYFPAVSAGWNVSNEDFFPESSFVSRLKIRGSWGQLGNQSINSNFPYASLINIGSSFYANGEILQGAAQSTMANRGITWEKGETLNIGVDFGLLSEQLSGSIEYYKRDTRDLLGTLPIPYVIGQNAPVANVFSMRNSGIELSLEWKDQIKDFNYSIGVNLSTVNNEVTDLDGLDFIKSSSSILQVGEPMNSIYGYESLGMFRDQAEIDAAPKQFGKLTPGDIRFKDQLTIDTNGDGIPDKADGVINADDRVSIGDRIPKVNFGANINLDYKGFDASISLQGSAGNKVYFREALVYPLYNAGNITKWQLEESWTPENLDAKFPVLKTNSGASNNAYLNSTYVFNASYLRLRNVTLGYTLPKSILGKTPISNLRVYVSGQNLLTFHHLPQGIDPLTPNGSQGNTYPLTKGYTLGLNVTF